MRMNEEIGDVEERFVSAIFKDTQVLEMLERTGLGSDIVTKPFLTDVLDLLIKRKGEGLPLDIVSIAHYALKEEFCEQIELADLLGATDTSFHAKTDLTILVEEYKRRHLRANAVTLSNMTDDDEFFENSAQVQAAIKEVTEVGMGEPQQTQRDRAMKSLTNRKDIMEGKEENNAVRIETGIDCIDRYLRPLSTATSDFNCLLFAATSTGKSSLMAQMVSHNVKRGLNIMVALGETNYNGLIEQMAGQLAKVPIDEYDFRSELAPKQKKYMEALEDIVSHCGENLWIYDDQFYIEDIINRARNLAEENGGLDCVFIDHMHCLKTRQKFTDERLKYNYISGLLKPLGIELNCPILCLAQPSRALKTSDRPPMLSDLKESGNLEDDCDRCWALWLPPVDSSGNPQDRKSECPEIRLFQLKFRRGRVWDVTLKFEKCHTRFSDRD